MRRTRFVSGCGPAVREAKERSVRAFLLRTNSDRRGANRFSDELKTRNEPNTVSASLHILIPSGILITRVTHDTEMQKNESLLGRITQSTA